MVEGTQYGSGTASGRRRVCNSEQARHQDG